MEEEYKNEIISALKKTAVFAFPTDPTPEVYNRLFPRGYINTPLDRVKMGENQFVKFSNNRNGDSDHKYLTGMAYQTLTSPALVYLSEEFGDDGKRKDKHVYIKSYITRDYKTVVSVIALQNEEDKEKDVCISSHIASLNTSVNKIKSIQNIIYLEISWMQ